MEKVAVEVAVDLLQAQVVTDPAELEDLELVLQTARVQEWNEWIRAVDEGRS